MGERKASGGVIAAQYYVLRKVTTATFLWEACQQIWTKLGVAGALAVAHAAACLFACTHARSGDLAGSSKDNGRRPHVPLSTEMIFPAADVVVVVVTQLIHKDMNRKPQGMFCKQFVIKEYKRIWFSRSCNLTKMLLNHAISAKLCPSSVPRRRRRE